VHEGRVADYRAANEQFHQALYEGTANAYLAELAAATRRRLAPFRGAQLEAPDRLRQSHLEHGEILTCVLRGDAAGAAAAQRAHLAATAAAWSLLGQGRAA
jgi:DNA-binding GntR family transcriptional regulator